MTTRAEAPEEFRVLSQIVEGRSTCRAFTPDEVSRQDIERVLALAQQTPSWCNTQPWELVITSGDATRRLREGLQANARTASAMPDFEFPAGYRGRYLDRRRACGFQLYDALGIARDDMAGRARQAGRNLEFFGAPHVAVVSCPEALRVYGAVDCGLYLSTFVIGAQALGISTAVQGGVAAYAPFIRDVLGLPADRRVVAAVAFGYPDVSDRANAFRTERAPVSQVVTWRE